MAQLYLLKLLNSLGPQFPISQVKAKLTATI